jgi:hypothetical protein
MRTLRRWPLLALTILVFVAVSACGSSGHGTPGTSRAPGASGQKQVNAAGAVSATSAASGGSQAGGASGTSTASGGSQGNNAGGAPGAPGGNSGDQNQAAPGAPLTIPDLIQGAGSDINDALNSLKTGASLPIDDPPRTYDGLIDQCGGTLCVNIVVQEATGPTPVLGAGDTPEDPSQFTQCQLMNMEPGPNAQVARGSTLVLVTGTSPCDSSSSDSSGSPADTTSGSPADTTSAP